MTTDKQIQQPPAYIVAFRWACIILAMLILLVQHATHRSMWLDESSLALNFQERSFGELTQPLDYQQTAPIGFLLTVKAITTVFGITDYSLRLFPLLAGFANIFLVYWVVKQMYPSAIPIAMAMIATSPFHIIYATEFKQYNLDATVTLLYILLTMRYLQSPTPRHLIFLIGFGVVGVWFSHPIIFVLAGIGMVLWLNAVLRRDWRATLGLTIMGVMQVISFGLVYWVSYRSMSDSALGDFMTMAWSDYFFRFTAESVVKIFFEFFTLIGGLYNFPLLVLGLYGFVIGIIQMRKLYVALLLSPIPFMLLASYLDFYPIVHRFLLFILAPIMIIIACGWWDTIEKIGRAQKWVGMGILVILSVLLIIRIEVPFYKSEVRSALAFVDEFRTADEALYTTFRMSRTAQFYGYAYQMFPTELPTDERVWVIAETPLVREDFPSTYTAYEFTGVWVVCVPTPTVSCPTDVLSP